MREENKTTRTYHEIDDTVKIKFKVPAGLQEMFDMAEESDLSDDGNYFNLADTIDTMCKNCYAAGEMSEREWDTIIRRYKQW